MAVIVLQCCMLATANQHVLTLGSGSGIKTPSPSIRENTSERQLPKVFTSNKNLMEGVVTSKMAENGTGKLKEGNSGETNLAVSDEFDVVFTTKTRSANRKRLLLAITSGATALQDAELGVPYRADLEAAYTYANPTGLPDGLQLGNSSIKGIPTAVGTFTIGLSATSKGKTSKQTFRLTVKPMELVADNTTIYTDVSTPIVLIIRGGLAPVKFSIESGPAFCKLQEYSLECTPLAVGVFPVKFLLVDKAGNTARQTISINAVVDPSIGSNKLQRSTSKTLNIDNPSAAHNALQRIPTKCKNTTKEYYSGV